MIGKNSGVTMKPVMKPFPSRPFLTRPNTAIISVFIIYALFVHGDRASILRRISLRPSASDKASQRAHDSTAQRPDLPPPLAPIVPPAAGPIYNFTVPHLTSFYYDTLSNGSTKLYLMTSGIMMGFSKRNLTAAACLVGNDVYPAQAFVGETAQCIVTRRLLRGEKIAPVLAYDEPLRKAEAGPVTLETGVIARIFPGDLSPLPNDSVLRGNLSGRDKSEFRVGRSKHRIGPSDNFEYGRGKYRPRYQLCQMTMVAPNSHMIDDWANYHRRIGVDMVYIFDNGASLDLGAIYKDRPDIEVVQWPYHKCQTQTVTLFLLMARSRCERVFMHDSDEYAMLGLGDGSCLTTGVRPLVRFSDIAMEKGFPNAKLLSLVMTNSGFLHRPEGVVPMNYIHRRHPNQFSNGKTICHVDEADWQAGSIHMCGWHAGHRVPAYVANITEWGQLKMRPTQVDDPPYLIHYRQRSWEEWIEKWDAGRISGKLVADEFAGKYTMDNPAKSFMETRPEYKYTHFRDKIYKRVMRDGRIDEQVVVQTKNGKRCEMLYKIVGNSVTGPVRERCE